jgi:putative acetyltransferase
MTTSDRIVRAERAGDAAAVRAVHEAAFPTADEADLVDRLRANGTAVVAVVGERAGTIVAHAVCSPVRLDGTEGGLGLAPVAVLPAHQSRGHDSDVVRGALAICRARGAPFVVVLGAPAYYARFGFEPAAHRGLHDEYGGGDAFQVLVLREGGLPSAGGRVRYGPEFAAFGG